MWWRFYHEPHESHTANQAELEYIGANGINNKIQNVPFNWRDARRLLGCRQILGASLGQFAGNTTLVFFLTWFPSYLANERHLPWLHVGFFATWPFLAAAIGILFGGWISRPVVEANRLRQHQSKVTNNFRFIAVQLYYRGELGKRQ